MSSKDMEPGDIMLMQMKAKFPKPRRATESRPKKLKKVKNSEEKISKNSKNLKNLKSKNSSLSSDKPKKVESRKKEKNSKKKKKEIKVQGSESDSSQGQIRSTDSGNVSDSNSSNSCSNINTEEIFAPDSHLINSLTSIDRSLTSMNSGTSFNESFIVEEEETAPKIQLPEAKPKKLSNRVAFFEKAIKNASGNEKSTSDNPEKPKFTENSSKKAAFLAAVEKSELKSNPKENSKDQIPKKSFSLGISRKNSDSAYTDSSGSELYEYDASDPLDEFLENSENGELNETEGLLQKSPGLLYFTERDMNLKSEKKLIKKVAASIEENGVNSIKTMLLKRLNSTGKIKIGILGDSLSGKSTLIQQLGGLITAEVNKYTGRIATCHQPTHFYSKFNENAAFTELPGIADSGRYSAENYAKTVDLEDFDCFLVLSSTWFKKKHQAWSKMLLSKYNKKVLFVRTKLDDSIDNDRRSRPRNHDQAAVIAKVRNHCHESLYDSTYDSIIDSIHDSIYLISAAKFNLGDGKNLVRDIIQQIGTKDTKKINYSDEMIMSVSPICIELIYQKREILFERIWKVAAISTISGVMPIGGFNLTADIDFLRSEIIYYKLQLGVDDVIMKSLPNGQEMIDVWKLVCEGDGLLCLLRQSVLDQKWEEFSKFMNKLPLIGGNVSFAATCSVLKYCLTELCTIAVRHAEKQLMTHQ